MHRVTRLHSWTVVKSTIIPGPGLGISWTCCGVLRWRFCYRLSPRHQSTTVVALSCTLSCFDVRSPPTHTHILASWDNSNTCRRQLYNIGYIFNVKYTFFVYANDIDKISFYTIYMGTGRVVMSYFDRESQVFLVIFLLSSKLRILW